MTVSQGDKAKRFRALHEAPGAFVIANPWDAGSARMLAGARLPGARDLERRQGRRARPARRQGDAARRRWRNAAPSSRRPTCRCRRISRRASATRPTRRPRRSGSRPGVGLVGGSIEDATGNKDTPLFDIEARDRARGRRGRGGARAAVPVHADRARRELPARQARPRRRDQAPAGLREGGRRRADGARPARPRRGARGLRARSRSRSTSWSASRASRSRVAELEAAGVKRISLATSLYRAAMSGLIDAAREVKEQGHLRLPRPHDAHAGAESPS